MCRAIKEDKVSFVNLDAKKYLDDINRTIEDTGSSYFSVKGDKLQQVFHPWRRFLARMFDIFIYHILWSAFLAFVLHFNLATGNSWINVLNTFIVLPIMGFFEPIWLRLFGTTLGKAIFGLRIENPDGRRMSYYEGFARTWGIIGAGMGYNIPFYSLVRLYKCYKLCRENETQAWDESISYTLKDTKWYRGVIYIGAYAALFAVLIVIVFAQNIPPNRGNLTVAEFVENYNYYSKFLSIDFGNEYLNENGKWAEKEFDGTTYIEVGKTEKPEYSFTIENGYVTGVSFAVEIKNSHDWIGSYDKQMVLASLAYACAQNEMGLFSKIPSRITEKIYKNKFEDFHFAEAGITCNCDTEYSGYIKSTSDILFSDETAAETYFSLKFSVKIQE